MKKFIKSSSNIPNNCKRFKNDSEKKAYYRAKYIYNKYKDVMEGLKNK